MPLKKLLNSFRQWWASRELDKQIEQAELATAFLHIPVVIREAHETYKVGDFTVTVMGSEAELKSRMLLNKANADKSRSLQRERAVDTAFANLTPAFNIVTDAPITDPNYPRMLVRTEGDDE